MGTVYEAAGGFEGLLRLAHAWHERVLADEVVSHAFQRGTRPDHGQRLAAYWAKRSAVPPLHTDTYGDESFVVRIHSGNGPHEEMDRRAIACFDEALVDADLAGDERLRTVLHDYFAWATTTTMSRYHDSADEVPAGLAIPKWSWDGLVGWRLITGATPVSAPISRPPSRPPGAAGASIPPHISGRASDFQSVRVSPSDPANDEQSRSIVGDIGPRNRTRGRRKQR